MSKETRDEIEFLTEQAQHSLDVLDVVGAQRAIDAIRELLDEDASGN